ncbi:hypothetical protein G9X64_04470 [Rhizobium sophorae]|uniref:Uncharacterized protein n=1 Tax=Rhizobium sophorae TaxID=1535242 RepID=A0A7Y3S2D2_9HYPH|nr:MULTISPECIES: hypothetical protein [Rhizobium]MBB4388455.1 hypothetical protein [Rhizobium leguminosarum]NNU35754.1 hypothetical protein [Rhizobium sophorae]ULJ76804.1 hypothetical protein MF410_01035 [Rhizobium sp. C104]
MSSTSQPQPKTSGNSQSYKANPDADAETSIKGATPWRASRNPDAAARSRRDFINGIGPLPPSRLFLGHWLLIGIRGQEFAKSPVLGMAFLLIDNHEVGTQLDLKQKQKLVHIAIEAVAPGLRPEAWIRWIQWVEVAKIFLIKTVDERVNVAWQ